MVEGKEDDAAADISDPLAALAAAAHAGSADEGAAADATDMTPDFLKSALHSRGGASAGKARLWATAPL